MSTKWSLPRPFRISMPSSMLVETNHGFLIASLFLVTPDKPFGMTKAGFLPGHTILPVDKPAAQLVSKVHRATVPKLRSSDLASVGKENFNGVVEK